MLSYRIEGLSMKKIPPIPVTKNAFPRPTNERRRGRWRTSTRCTPRIFGRCTASCWGCAAARPWRRSCARKPLCRPWFTGGTSAGTAPWKPGCAPLPSGCISAVAAGSMPAPCPSTARTRSPPRGTAALPGGGSPAPSPAAYAPRTLPGNLHPAGVRRAGLSPAGGAVPQVRRLGAGDLLPGEGEASGSCQEG